MSKGQELMRPAEPPDPSSPPIGTTGAAGNVATAVEQSLHRDIGALASSTPTPCTAAEVPQELWDTIIDYLHDDHTTLLVCCRVRKSWLPSSRLHLEDHLRFRVPFLPPAAESLSTEEQDDTDILARISQPYRIRSLTIKWAPRERYISQSSSRYDVRIHDSLSFAVSALPNLVSLSLIGLRLRYSGHSFEGGSIPYFLQAALQLPRLREVTLVGAILVDGSSIPRVSSGAAIASSLEKLSIRETVMDRFTLPWLDSLLRRTKNPRSASTPLRYLDIPIVSSFDTDVTRYTTLLSCLGPNLHHLGLQFSPVRSLFGTGETGKSISSSTGLP
ncbi:uncharacterized protein PHACADRAFT_263377 [Phanerochaete carnosa HHB-10118-sp]|uniref:F-box domain-containing protein n=1 Tax=Phanerochaete carnosa (strain HHB-10118-sp) TaxID=650164 RepID=K5VXM3_PHACS|nr:uncharacterized protein PHACADRAFT_263377 [Phanerochaete carnosa HHB-10118-sp]EKM51334.1 hypothetical protein PHACADRAFT_263377 [Phanerochaete carnosa HHB-10118-sp]